MKLLEDILVIDFSQFLSGPSASLRLADLGARVIKVEKPGSGDICRQLYVSDVKIEGESTIFHAINRNKESFQADLKERSDLSRVKKLLAKADVMLHNFRPGVMERLGLSYDEVRQINSEIIYTEISGYGPDGPWKNLPGQDLLLQAVSGLTYLNNEEGKAPTPMGVAVIDILAGTYAAQGILAALYNKVRTGKGSLIQVSMLESALDFQFEVLTCFLNNGQKLPQRSNQNHGHVYVAAPYGVYRTTDGYLALAMGQIPVLGELLEIPKLTDYRAPNEWFDKRDQIKKILASQLRNRSTRAWLDILEPAGIWCAEVNNYEDLLKQEGYKNLEMEIEVKTSSGQKVRTTRCPIRVDGQKLVSFKGAPALGEDTTRLNDEFQLTN